MPLSSLGPMHPPTSSHFVMLSFFCFPKDGLSVTSFFSNRSRNLCVGGTLDTGTLREMRPRESALVAFLSSSYQPRNPVAAATRGCAGGLGGLSWVELPKDCRCRGNGRVRPCVSVCLSTLLIPHCAAQTRFDMGISRAHLTPETTVQLGSRHTARGVERGEGF